MPSISWQSQSYTAPSFWLSTSLKFWVTSLVVTSIVGSSQNRTWYNYSLQVVNPNQEMSFLPSHTHITSFKPLCVGRLRDVRENESPSRYPHISGHIHSHHKWCAAERIRLHNVRVRREKSEGEVRENKYPSRALSPLYIGLWEGSCEYVRDIFEFLDFSRPIQREIKIKFNQNQPTS